MTHTRQSRPLGRRRVSGLLPSPAVVLAIGLAASAPLHAAQDSPPVLTAPVNDFANIIDAATERELDRRIKALQAASGDVVVVATVRTLQPHGSIEEYAVRMFENAGQGIGQKGRDNGALILVAVEERQVRIEVGYDLEEFITDGYAGETIRSVIRPEFQRGRYSRGLLAGTTRIINRVAAARDVSLQDVPASEPAARPSARVPFGSIAFMVFLLLMALGRGGRRRRRRWGGGPWSGWNSGVGPFGGGMFGGGMGGFGGRGGGGFGGGFGGFGGGRSGGGGASGGW